MTARSKTATAAAAAVIAASVYLATGPADAPAPAPAPAVEAVDWSLVESTIISHFAERQTVGTSNRLTLHSAPIGYRRDGKWLRTRERFRLDGGRYLADEAVHALTVEADGQIVATWKGHTTRLKLRALTTINPAGKEAPAMAVDLSTWTLDASEADAGRLTWRDAASGSAYSLWFFAYGFRDSFVLGPGAKGAVRGKSQALRFGLAFDCSLPAGAPEEFDTEAQIAVAVGKGRIRLRPAALPDTRDAAKPHDERRVHRERWSHKAGRLLQTVPLEALDGVGELHTEVSYQEGTDAYTGCIDNSLWLGSQDGNYGSHVYLATRLNAYYGLLSFDLPDLGSVVVSNAYLTLVCYASSGTSTISAYQALKPWEETDSSWNQWDKSGSNEWGTAGAMNADDAGVENTGDGSGADRKATAAFAEAGQTGTGTKTLGSGQAGFTALAQAWLDATATDTYGIVIRCTSVADTYQFYRSSEYGTTAERPKLTIVYTAGGGGDDAVPPAPIFMHHQQQQQGAF